MMNRNEIFEKLNEIFRDIFDDESIVVTDTTSALDIEDWDSLMQISIIAAVENAFNFKFDVKKAVLLKNVGEMADIIENEIS